MYRLGFSGQDTAMRMPLLGRVRRTIRAWSAQGCGRHSSPAASARYSARRRPGPRRELPRLYLSLDRDSAQTHKESGPTRCAITKPGQTTANRLECLAMANHALVTRRTLAATLAAAIPAGAVSGPQLVPDHWGDDAELLELGRELDAAVHDA